MATALASLPPSWSTVRTTGRAGRRLGDVDSVVVGPGGVFVIGSSDAAGAVTTDDRLLRLDGRAPERDPGALVSAAARVADLCGVGSDVVRPVLCLLREEPIAAQVDDVVVCSTSSLAPALTGRPAVLSPAAVAGTLIRLDAGLRPPTDHADRSRSVSGASASGRARAVVGVLLAVLLLAGLLLTGMRVGGRMDDLPGPGDGRGTSGR